MKWGLGEERAGPNSLSFRYSSYSTLLHWADRSVRKEAFTKYYEQYDAHRNSLAAAYNGSVETDAYYARARNSQEFTRSLASSPDNVPVKLYDSLGSRWAEGLPAALPLL